ncbi:MAG TPA: Gfo/Idh/MocA family oxidoreductase, partial [Verrucomicrobiae bacterium]|nr:Gfo/Idh/MocA family oxidoreductase [Verrucomicrobiae bacterium]
MTSPWQPAGGRELRVGLAGLGSMGRNHLRILSGRTDLVLAAVADPVGAALAVATSQTGAQGFDEPLAMIAEADLDAVVIAAPTTAHVPLALAAIEHGIAVLVEKPLAATTDEAMRIVAAARA